MSYILLHSGDRFCFTEPERCKYVFNDIAIGLSRAARFSGQTLGDIAYSVAQHSVFVARLLPPKWRLYGLLHDAQEAFIGDMPTPLKRLLPRYQLIEERTERTIARRFNLKWTDEIRHTVKHADLVALATEKRDLMPSDAEWPLIAGIVPDDSRIVPLDALSAHRAFVDAYMLFGYRECN